MKDKVLHIRLSSEEMKKIKDLADSQNRTVSAQALMYINRCIKNEKKLS